MRACSFNCIESGICEFAGPVFVVFYLYLVGGVVKIYILDMHSSVLAMSSLAKCWKFSDQISVQFPLDKIPSITRVN